MWSGHPGARDARVARVASPRRGHGPARPPGRRRGHTPSRGSGPGAPAARAGTGRRAALRASALPDEALRPPPARAGHGAEGGQRARAVGHPGGLRGAALRHTAERAPMVAACGRSWRGHRGTRGRCGAPAGQPTERVAGSRPRGTPEESSPQAVVVVAALAGPRPRGTPREPERPGVARSPGGLGATAGHARRGGGRCRPRGCLASGTSGGGGRLDAPGGTRAGRRGVGAWRDAGREPSRSDRAGTDVW